ncbi:uncharacterized protein LOC127869485 [Dreissena polymorpha]|uniref:Uncharacterized protein n=1 Tax=Dreissena polymorpha TaxID=45954 RepID=A0A9D4RP99_DREPO|nr:uncharacterized protein LOC127869485 [Dreissena polymorpha]KAH3875819.1 hypothetical protein DPMN_039097 [Dreissena polymorpha]
MTKMNKLILLVFVVCVAVVSAKDFNSEYVLYNIDDEQLGLQWPSDCRRSPLLIYARKCNLNVIISVNGFSVEDPASKLQITRIPWVVSNNQHCRDIIGALTARCEGTTTNPGPTTTDASYYNGEGDYQ